MATVLYINADIYICSVNQHLANMEIHPENSMMHALTCMLLLISKHDDFLLPFNKF